MKTPDNARLTYRGAAAALALAATLMHMHAAPVPANAIEECIATTTNGHGGAAAATGDCVDMNVYMSAEGQIVVEYWGNQDFDFYQLRWSRPGKAEEQQRLSGNGPDGGLWTLSNPRRNTLYTFKVQACYSDIFGSDCTPWKLTEFRLAAKSQAPSATCKSGYVWREAFAGDLVCVTPETRRQAAYDNSQAAARRDPNAGFGPYGCASGYVWRVARPDDLVCVTPETRAQTAYDNSQAAARRASAAP